MTEEYDREISDEETPKRGAHKGGKIINGALPDHNVLDQKPQEIIDCFHSNINNLHYVKIWRLFMLKTLVYSLLPNLHP